MTAAASAPPGAVCVRRDAASVSAPPSPADAALARLRAAGAPFGLRDRVGEYLGPGEAGALEEQAGRYAEAMLRALLLDVDRDPALRDAAARLVRSLLHGPLAGRYDARPRLGAGRGAEADAEAAP